MAAAETLLIFLVFVVSAAWPIPEPNESHYVSKAKHYWNREWLAEDFFLQTPDWHSTFYLTTGWLTRFMDLPDVVRVGRVATWLLLAFFWRRLSWSLVPRLGASVVSAALVVGLNERFQMAGEWFVGGFEAKGFAYALVFGALAELVRGRWNFAWLLLGGATAFHVLVGGWSAIAVGACWIFSGAERPRIASMAPGLLGFALLAIPIVVQSLALTRGVDAATLIQANDIYVYRRVPHHLFFYDMKLEFRWRFAALMAVWSVLAWLSPNDKGAWRLKICVWASLAIAAVGVALGTLALWRPELAARGLRFYWFRLADVLAPVGVGLTATQLAWQTAAWFPRSKALAQLAPLALFALGSGLLLTRDETPFSAVAPRADKSTRTANYPDWQDVCRWVAGNTPENACFITPRPSQTFRWYAERSEVATLKDMPQDAANLVEWWNRIEALHATGDPDHRWRKSLTELDPSRLTRLGETYGAQYLLTDADPALPFRCVYRNKTYAVYQLPRS
ncbi:MAG TPA: DUF6798 domain-containing protein [Pirellulales bacterium]